MFTLVQRHGPVGVCVCESGCRVVRGLEVCESVSQHVLKALGLPSLAFCAVFACVFCFFLAQVQKEFVVRDEC